MPADAWEQEWSQLPTAFRLARRIHATSLPAALNGHGGLHVEGRWHEKGQKIVYTGCNRPLCVLERLVHLDAGLHDASVDLVFFRLRIPASVSRNVVSPTTLDGLVARHGRASEPPDWRVQDHPLCRRLGSAWLASERSCLLIVPSSVVPQEANVLINPNHPDMASLLAANAGPFTLEAYQPDQRVADVIQFAASRTA
jgi:RES domain-containing protein